MHESAQDDALNEIDFLARSANRVHLLNKLREHDQLDRDELKSSCKASRTTLQRNLDALEENGWVKSTNRTYTLTTKGETIIAQFLELVDAVRVVNQIEPFLEWIPKGEFDLDLRLLVDADLTLSTPNNPYAPVNEHVEALKTVTSFRGLLSVVGRGAVETAWRQVLNGEAEHELVIEEGVVKTLCEDPHYEDMVKEAMDTGRYQIYIYDGDIPYYLGILDETVQIGVEDDKGLPRGLLEYNSDSIVVKEWAEQTYNSYKQKSKPFHTSTE